MNEQQGASLSDGRLKSKGPLGEAWLPVEIGNAESPYNHPTALYRYQPAETPNDGKTGICNSLCRMHSERGNSLLWIQTGPSPAKFATADRAIEQAKSILQRIDERWPVA